jgi:hypothetical protein
MVLGQIVSALRAVDIGYLHTSEASSADRRHLKLTLRAEVNGGGNLRAAMGARKEQRLPEQKVNDSPDATRHDDHDQHPERRRHPASLHIAAYISHEQDIARERRSPRISHEQSHGQQFMFVMGQYAMEEVLNSSKDNDCQYDSPGRNEAEFILTSLRSLQVLVP